MALHRSPDEGGHEGTHTRAFGCCLLFPAKDRARAAILGRQLAWVIGTVAGAQVEIMMALEEKFELQLDEDGAVRRSPAPSRAGAFRPKSILTH